MIEREKEREQAWKTEVAKGKRGNGYHRGPSILSTAAAPAGKILSPEEVKWWEDAKQGF